MTTPEPAAAGPRHAAEFPTDRQIEDTDLVQSAAREARGPRFEWPTVLVLAGMVVSLAIVATDHFRRGSVLFAGCAILAFFLRLILSDRDAGWLAVRSRGIDLAVLAVLGLSLALFALIVPPPS
jgi:hypothetical protein